MNYRSKNLGVRYTGGKGKVADGIAPIINRLCANGTTSYWEPFVGSGKIMAGVRASVRVGSDHDRHIVDLIEAVRTGWDPPDLVTEADYAYWKRRAVGGIKRDPMIGFVGYACSFGGRFFEGYARSRKTDVNFAASARTSLLRQRPYLRDVEFICGDYRDVWPRVGRSSKDFGRKVVYCDPPYEGTKPCGSDKAKFDSKEFWDWAEARHFDDGWAVLVSEYACPSRWASCVWQRSTAAGIRFGTSGDGGRKGSGKKKVEKLYLLGADTKSRIGLGLV